MSDAIPKPLGRRERNKAERRQAILNAAMASFLERGYSATSMSGLLETLGGSKATLWKYFRSKEELFAAVADSVTQSFRKEIVDLLVPDAGVEVPLQQFCLRLLERLDMPDAVATWRMVAAESGRFPEVGHVFHERVIRSIETTLIDFLECQIAEGRLRDEPARGMANLLLSLCWGRQNRRLWGEADASSTSIEDEALQFVTLFMRAFMAHQASRKPARQVGR